MILNPSQKKILELLVRQEEMISDLYEIFSRQFPEQKPFWEKLSLEEAIHAELIQKLSNSAEKGKVRFTEKKLTITVLDAFLSRLDTILQKAKKEEFTLLEALICAADYESSLIEKKIFSHFDSPDKQLGEALKTLQLETEEHVELIKNAQFKVTGGIGR